MPTLSPPLTKEKKERTKYKMDSYCKRRENKFSVSKTQFPDTLKVKIKRYKYANKT